MMFRRKRYPYSVTMHLSGRHPYLRDHSLDVPSRDIIVVVQALNWADAEIQAFKNVPRDKPMWSCSVKAIARGDELEALAKGTSLVTRPHHPTPEK